MVQQRHRRLRLASPASASRHRPGCCLHAGILLCAQLLAAQPQQLLCKGFLCRGAICNLRRLMDGCGYLASRSAAWQVAASAARHCTRLLKRQQLRSCSHRAAAVWLALALPAIARPAASPMRFVESWRWLKHLCPFVHLQPRRPLSPDGWRLRMLDNAIRRLVSPSQCSATCSLQPWQGSRRSTRGLWTRCSAQGGRHVVGVRQP